MCDSAPKRQGERIFSLLLLVFSVTAFWQSYEISGFQGLATAGVFPMLASATMVVAAAFILVQSCLHSPERSSAAQGPSGFLHAIMPSRLIIMLLLISGYLIAMPTLGFLIASGIFLFLSFGYLWQKTVTISLLLTLVSVLSVYFVFRQLFQVVLPKGSWLQGWF